MAFRVTAIDQNRKGLKGHNRHRRPPYCGERETIRPHPGAELYEIRRNRPKNDDLAGLDQLAGLRRLWLPKGPPVPIDAVLPIAGAGHKPVSSGLQGVFVSHVMCASANVRVSATCTFIVQGIRLNENLQPAALQINTAKCKII